MNPARSYRALWFGVLSFFILGLSFVLPLQPNDYWWYVRLGGEIVRTGTLPATDAFSWTQAGQPVFYQAWLAAVAFYLVQSKGGVVAVFLMRALILWVTYGILWLLCVEEGLDARWATLMVVVTAFAGAGNWSHRPQLLAYPLFALAFWLLRRAETRPRLLFALPVLSALWVNLHGSYVVLLALLGAAWAGSRRRAMMSVFLLALLATLVNPHGVGAWRYVFFMLQNQSGQGFSAEWMPPVNQGWQMGIFFALLLLVPRLLTSSPRQWGSKEWLWYLGFGWLALRGVRYVIWFLLLLPSLLSPLLASWPLWREKLPQRIAPKTNYALAGLLPLVAFSLLPGVRPAEALPIYNNTPVAATTWLAQHPDLPGPLWADLDYSAYLVWALPERPVWIDTRFELYPPSQWQRYQQIAAARFDWQEMLLAEGVRLLFLSRARQADLIAALERAPAWQQVYLDEQAVIYVRP